MPFGPLSARAQSTFRTGVRIAFAATAVACVSIAIGAIAAAPSHPAKDPLDLPALKVHQALNSPKIGIANTGKRLVAVGPRGHIVLSDDQGATWRQVDCPVSSDLLAVRFTDANNGWITGHDAVLLQTTDGGQTWQRRLDGRSVLKLLQDTYGERASGGSSDAAKFRADVERAAEQSATPGVLPYPLFDVAFLNANEGFVVGAFGTILHTADGGRSWEPWLDRTDNPKGYHLYAVRAQGGRAYVAGEGGLVQRLDTAQNRFVSMHSPYNGTFFGLQVLDGAVLAYGLRGNAFITADDGAQWTKVNTGVQSTLVGAFRFDDGRVLLAAQSGRLLQSNDAGRSFSEVKQPPVGGEVFSAAMAGPSTVAVTTMGGVRVVGAPTAAP